MSAGAQAGYAADAARLKALYEAIDVEALYAPVWRFSPQPGERVLDVGAGTGRDAAYWAARGCSVAAVDPVAALWAQNDLICRIDTLPDLQSLTGRDKQFDVITVVAVLHHLAPPQQIASLTRLAQLMAPGGRLLLSLRHGPAHAARPGFGIDVDSLRRCGRDLGLRAALQLNTPSLQPENLSAGVHWTWLVLTHDLS